MMNTILSYFIAILILFSVTTRADQNDIDDGICKSMVEKRRYICHEHNVTTKDGYILSLQRIPNSLSGRPADKPPVLLQHGILVNGASWLLNPRDQSLAYILVDTGYDVWISNTRGTKYSRRHISLDSSDPEYWEWSWDQLAAYDLPATVQFVYNQTGQKLHYVGHSLGTLIALAAFSQGKLVDMIRSAALLSPIAHLDHMSSVILNTAARSLGKDLYNLGLREFDLREIGKPGIKVLEKVCKFPLVDCFHFLKPFTGENCCISPSKAVRLLKHAPQPTSTKNLIHLSQMVKTGTIAMYDYENEDDNVDVYQQPTPPTYEMQNVTIDLPLFLGIGGRDYLSDVVDVEILLEDFENRTRDSLTIQYIEEYAHLDFIFGDNADELVYDHVMNFFELH